MAERITALIPVKEKSGRLPGKNILPFGESTLLEHKIKQLRECEAISNIIVSSDSDKMLKMAEEHGVESWKRPERYTLDEVPFGEFVEYICRQLTGDHVLWACCTSPLVDTELYRKGIAVYFDALQSGYDSLVTVTRFQHYLMDENGPMNFSRGISHQYSQNLPVYWAYTNGINLAPRKKMIEWKYHFGEKPFMMEVTKKQAVDIDDIYDYVMAQAYYEMEMQ